MKSALSLLASLALTPMALTATPIGTAFTYQGRLNNSYAANATVTLTFRLWSDLTSGTEVGALTAPIPVTANNWVVFTDQVNFGATPFNGSASYLEVFIDNVKQVPRIRLAPTPNATYASTAGTVKDGAIQISQLGTVGVPSAGQVLGYNGSSLVWQNPPAASGAWAVGGNNASAGSFLGTLNSLPLELRVNNGRVLTLNPADVQVSPGANLSFGTTTRQMLNLWGTQYGIGVQSYNLYFRTDNADGAGSFAWYRGGRHSDDGGVSGEGGQTLMSLDNTALHVSAGTSDLNKLLTQGNTTAKLCLGYMGYNGITEGGVIQSVTGGAGSALLINPLGGGVNFGGSLAVNGVVSASSDATEAFKVSGKQAGYELQDRVLAGVAGRWVMFAADGAMGFWNAGANRMTLTSTGHLTVPVLTITGGADMAEPFKMSGKDLPKGAVVVIDEENPGHLRLSESAYDTRVAGIISGANGINPGINLSQQGVMEGDQNVALSGRVYVQADASNGPIKPGDLLTTAATPGHAMKVADHGKAQGAILGKAMTSLQEGRGMVLVLVTLQ